MARSVTEWVGKTYDSKAPPRVRQRVFDRDKGCCHLCKLPIKTGETWEADHVIALINGGANAESNLAPAHSHCHVGKSARDLKEKAKVAAIRQRFTGAKQPTGKLKSAGFPQSTKSAQRSEKASGKIAPPPRRPLFVQIDARTR